MKVSILIPASGRPDMLRDMLDSLTASTNWIREEIEFETVFVVDADPKSMQIVEEYPTYFDGRITDYSPVKRGALWAWNRGLQLSTGDILVPAGDDHKFYEGWLDYALESHREKLGGYGVVGMNDLAYNGNTQVATMFLFDRAYCKEVMGGIFAPPCYEYLCVDLEWNEKAKSLGHFYWDERSIQEHLHSAHGKRPYDEHDRWKDSLGDRDMKTFEDRKARSFPIVWQTII